MKKIALPAVIGFGVLSLLFLIQIIRIGLSAGQNGYTLGRNQLYELSLSIIALIALAILETIFIRLYRKNH